MKFKRLWLVLMIVLAGCAPAAQSKPEDVTLRIAVLRIVDSLPMYVAEQQGLYAKHGVKIELIPVGSAPERDQLIAAKQADGMINELTSTMFYNKESIQVQSVRFARAATADTHLFTILAAKNSGITSVQDLKGVPVGISDGTIIAYLTDRMLLKQGLSVDEIQTVSIPNLADRLALLNSGELKATMLPEPLASLAVAQGALVILDDTAYPDLAHSEISFRKETLDNYPKAVKAFLAALEDAVTHINADPSKYDHLLVDLKIVPAPLQGTFKSPTFVTAGVPSEAQFNDMLAWAKEKGLLKKDLLYRDCVNPDFLPR